MLNKIVADRRQTVTLSKQQRPINALERDIRPRQFLFGKAIAEMGWLLIAECKLASPAKGRLCETYSVSELAKIYSNNGATALSVHTSPHFCGELEDIAKVREVSRLPILRKDFIIDEYQLYEACWAGADAVLLIAAILTDEQLVRFQKIAYSLGMDCLVEVHDAEELIRVQKTPAQLIGINNRNLKTFVTDIENTFSLLANCDTDRIFISESGIATKQDASRLKRAGIRGVLVGESLVKAVDIAGRTREMAYPDG
ncbi:MAG: Indole-3-glycerol-phosphate synthase [Firmicutes bacterium]|nr:Indole-3-glycerol-phosphate synthase [Bacillota bacterium]